VVRPISRAASMQDFAVKEHAASQNGISGELFIGRARELTPDIPATDPATGMSFEPGSVSRARNRERPGSGLGGGRSLSARGSDSRERFLEALAGPDLALGEEMLESAHAEDGLAARADDGASAPEPSVRLRIVREGSCARALARASACHGAARAPPLLPTPRPAANVRSPWALWPYLAPSNSHSLLGGGRRIRQRARRGGSVIVKAIPAHPGTRRSVAQAIVAAVSACQLPPGVFHLLKGIRHTHWARNWSRIRM